MKPTIYLGLGGTGNLAISYAKKLFEEEYGKGEIPAGIAFLGVDYQTDMDEDPNLASDIKEDFYNIQSGINPRQFYQIRSSQYGEFQWMFESNTGNIENSISKGARQVRTTGRLYSEMILQDFMAKFDNVYNDVASILGDAQTDHGVNIYIVMSLAGGTGAGSFITFANAIRQKYTNQIMMYGYGVTHSVFKAMDTKGNKVLNVASNTIASILDLDYLNTAEINNPITITSGINQTVVNSSIFDSFYVVDNKSTDGKIIKNVCNLCEVIGTCLYACGGETGAKFDAVLNNVGPNTGNYNVGYKKGWVQGLGACQVVYKGDLLAKTYGLKAAIELIRKMRQEGAEIHQAALNWTEEVGIREDGNEYNLLTDSIYAPAAIQKLRQPNLDVTDTDNAIQDLLNRYFVSLVDFPTEEILKNRVTSLKKALHDKIETYLKSENGVGNSIKFLASLKKFCEKYRTEMDEEAKMFNKSKEEKQANFDASAFKKYNDEKHGRFTWNRDQRNQELLDEYVARPAKEILKDLHEAKRRESAREIFIALLAEIDILVQSLKDLNQKLVNLSDEYVTELSNVQRETSDALIFEYDLSYSERVKMTMDSNDIVVADFIGSLGKSLTEIGIDTELNEKIKQYTESLPQALGYKAKMITDVVDNLSDDEYKKLTEEIKKKSARWLRIDDRGQCVNSGKSVMDAVMTQWVVSIYQQSEAYRSRLENDRNFIPNANGYSYFANEALRQRMIFCRIDGCIIPYCIESISEIAMKEYETNIIQAKSGQGYNPHFDKILFNQMEELDFKLKPELKNEALLYWVCGQLFGALDKNGGISSITENERIMKTDENNVPLTEEKKEQQAHTKYIYYKGKGGKKYVFFDPMAPVVEREKELGSTRDVAFAVFKKDIFPKYKSKIADDIKKQFTPRIAYWEERIKEIARLGIHSYIDRIVCSDKSSVTYFSQKTAELNQLDEEFRYIEDELVNQLKNLK